MANSFYSKALESFAAAGINWTSDTIKVGLATSGYVPNLATDQFLSAIAAGNRVGSPVTLASKTNVLGVLNAANAVFSALTGSVVTYVFVYKFVTGDSDSPLIILIDTATGLPLTPNGTDVTVVWDTGTNKIGAL